MRPAVEIIIENESRDKHYSILFTQRPDCEVWLSTHEGEGMGMKVDALYNMIDDFFKENH